MSRSLWMGDLEPYMDEAFIARVFQNISLPASVKVIRRKDNGLSAGYCFIEFATESEAERVLKLVNGTNIPGVTPSKRFRLNRSQAGKMWDIGPSYSIFVGELDQSVTDDKLEDYFMSKYRTVKGAKIVYEEGGVSRGYGFVRFSSEIEQKRALSEMQGARGLSSRPIRVSIATPKGKTTESSTTSTASATTLLASEITAQWAQQYADQYKYYQQYYSYYNSPYSSYYQQPSASTAAVHQQSVVPQQATSASYQALTAAQDKLEDPDIPLDTDEENDVYFALHASLLDGLGSHWCAIDSLTSRLPEVTSS